MSPIFFETLVIGFVGAILFVAIDRLERNGSVANFLKFLVLVVGGAAILHKFGPALLGIECFS
jgi:hypothetical protein